LQDLVRLITELAIDDDDMDSDWDITLTSLSIVVSAGTRDLYGDEVSAWEGARALWNAILDLGYKLDNLTPSEMGVVRRAGREKLWRGKVRMILEPLET
jgi:hypothetical protein